jgi:CheY-like chemotaxis protein
LNDLEGARLLVIEDDALVAQALQMMLSAWGCEVAVVGGIQEALEQLHGGERPQLILSDYRLRAGENGFDAVFKIRAEAQYDIPACLMSGDVESNLSNRCRDAGIYFLQKPVRPTNLRSQILQMLSTI